MNGVFFCLLATMYISATYTPNYAYFRYIFNFRIYVMSLIINTILDIKRLQVIATS